MKPTERNRKIAALTKLFDGNTAPLRELQPPMVVDLDQFSLDELEAIQRLQSAKYHGQDFTAQQAEVDRLLAGRELRLVPATHYLHYRP